MAVRLEQVTSIISPSEHISCILAHSIGGPHAVTSNPSAWDPFHLSALRHVSHPSSRTGISTLVEYTQCQEISFIGFNIFLFHNLSLDFRRFVCSLLFRQLPYPQFTINMLRLLTLSALVASSAAHFLLHYPATIGFDDDLEGTAPCGSFTPKFSSGNVTDFHVAGDSIALTSTHPAAVWLFRATLGTDDTATNWTNLLPVVSQTDLGNFCETNLTVPDSWVGQQGLVQVIQDAADGMLFQVRNNNRVFGFLYTNH